MPADRQVPSLAVLLVGWDSEQTHATAAALNSWLTSHGITPKARLFISNSSAITPPPDYIHRPHDNSGLDLGAMASGLRRLEELHYADVVLVCNDRLFEYEKKVPVLKHASLRTLHAVVAKDAIAGKVWHSTGKIRLGGMMSDRWVQTHCFFISSSLSKRVKAPDILDLANRETITLGTRSLSHSSYIDRPFAEFIESWLITDRGVEYSRKRWYRAGPEDEQDFEYLSRKARTIVAERALSAAALYADGDLIDLGAGRRQAARRWLRQRAQYALRAVKAVSAYRLAISGFSHGATEGGCSPLDDFAKSTSGGKEAHRALATAIRRSPGLALWLVDRAGARALLGSTKVACGGGPNGQGSFAASQVLLRKTATIIRVKDGDRNVALKYLHDPESALHYAAGAESLRGYLSTTEPRVADPLCASIVETWVPGPLLSQADAAARESAIETVLQAAACRPASIPSLERCARYTPDFGRAVALLPDSGSLGLERLQKLERSSPETFQHRDLHYENLILGADGLAAIDLELAGRCPFFYDVVYLAIMCHMRGDYRLAGRILANVPRSADVEAGEAKPQQTADMLLLVALQAMDIAHQALAGCPDFDEGVFVAWWLSGPLASARALAHILTAKAPWEFRSVDGSDAPDDIPAVPR